MIASLNWLDMQGGEFNNTLLDGTNRTTVVPKFLLFLVDFVLILNSELEYLYKVVF